MKKILMLILFTVLLVGCVNDQDTSVELMGTLKHNDTEVEGYSVSKGEVFENLYEEEISYLPITGEDVFNFTADQEITDLSVGMHERNSVLTCLMDVNEISSKEYSIDLCLDEDVEIVVSVSGKINEEEFKYFYPVHLTQ